MKNYYNVLGVNPDATATEIRRAYRRKAKLLHPDITGRDSGAFRELKDAYEILSDAHTRALFDEKAAYTFRGFGMSSHPFRTTHYETFNYREWLSEQEDDESRTKLIFFDLLHNNEDEAVREFKRMNMKNMNFTLSKWVTEDDFMGYGYILAEELVLRREYYDAVLLLEQLIHMEEAHPYYGIILPDVLDLARHVLRNNIEGNMNDELALDSWERALDLGLGPEDNMYFLLKMSDCYARIGDEDEARRYMEEAKHIGFQTA